MPFPDAPTLALLAGFIFILALTIWGRFKKPKRLQPLTFLLVTAAIPWAVLTVLGETILGWSTQNTCYPYLGCNIGFAGYDGFEHLFFGITLTLFLLWTSRAFPSYSLLGQSRLKTILNILAYVTLVAFCWEVVEYGIDTFRMGILHQQLVIQRLHIDGLEQSSNVDTMGDMLFDLVGMAIASLIVLYTDRKIFRSQA